MASRLLPTRQSSLEDARFRDYRARIADLRRISKTGLATDIAVEDFENLLAVYDEARAFLAMTSVFRQRREVRDQFEALALAVLRARGE